MDIFTNKKLEEAFDRIYLILCGDTVGTDPLRDKVEDAFADGSACDRLYQSAQQARDELLNLASQKKPTPAAAENLLDTIFGSFSGIERHLSKKMFAYGYLAATQPDFLDDK